MVHKANNRESIRKGRARHLINVPHFEDIGGKHGASSSSIARASDSTLPPHLSLPVSVSLSPSTMAKLTILVFLVAACAAVEVLGFAPSHNIHIISPSTYYTRAASFLHSNSPTPSASDDTDDDTTNSASADEQLTVEEQQKIGNLVADAEWAGLSMELADVVRTAVIEDLKKNSRDFLGKEDYLVGDFSKEIDKRVKAEIAKIREKDEYEVSVEDFLFLLCCVLLLCFLDML